MSFDPGYNPNRTIDLFALTTDGYIIAQDIACQYEYVALQRCPDSGAPLRVVAQINRSYQGLNELVAISEGTGRPLSFIFDISNDTYQNWWRETAGDLYIRPFEGPPRAANHRQRFFRTRAELESFSPHRG